MSEYRECDRCGERVGLHSEKQINYNHISLNLSLRRDHYDSVDRSIVFDLCGSCSKDYKEMAIDFRDNLKDIEGA